VNGSKGLARDAVASIARHLATIIAGFITVPIIVRMLGASRLGFWSLLGTAAFLLGLCDLGLNTATLRAAAGSDTSYAKQVARLAALMTTVLAVPAVAACVWWLFEASRQLPVDQRSDARTAVLIGLAGGVVGAASQSARSYAQGQGRIVALAWARAGAVALQLVVTVSLLLAGLGLSAVALGFASGALVEAILGFRAARDGVRAQGLLPRGDNRRELVRIAGSAMLTNLSVIFAVRADVLVLERITNLATIGAYSVAARLVDQGFTLVKQVSAALVPRLGKRAKNRGSSIRLGTMIIGIMAAGPLAAVAMSGRPILILWAGEPVDLPILGVALTWLSLAAMAAAVYEIPLSAITLGGDAWAAARFIALGSITNVTLSIVGGYAFGPWAVAASTFAGNLVLALLTWRSSIRTLRWDAQTVALTFLPILVSIPVAAVTAWACDRASLNGILSTAAGCLAAISVGAVLVFRLRPSASEVLA